MGVKFGKSQRSIPVRGYQVKLQSNDDTELEYEEVANPESLPQGTLPVFSFDVKGPGGKRYKLSLDPRPDGKKWYVYCKGSQLDLVGEGFSIDDLLLPVGDPSIGIR